MILYFIAALFLLAAASFITGVIQRRFSVKLSASFIAGTFIVGMFLAPQKLYCFTFAGFSVYVSIAEYLRQKDMPFAVCIVIKGICYHIRKHCGLYLTGHIYFSRKDMAAGLAGG